MLLREASKEKSYFGIRKEHAAKPGSARILIRGNPWRRQIAVGSVVFSDDMGASNSQRPECVRVLVGKRA